MVILLFQVLYKFKFNQRRIEAPTTPMDLSCVIRVSKSQMLEDGFKIAVVERAYAVLLELMSRVSTCLSFPEFTVFLVVQV